MSPAKPKHPGQDGRRPTTNGDKTNPDLKQLK
jgi:hypothetical protein